MNARFAILTGLVAMIIAIALTGEATGRVMASHLSQIPRCQHDDTTWHPLVERNSDGSIRCTYGHTHGDDPKSLDYAFGPLPVHLGGEISYPHETTHENHNKHNVYEWMVADVADCVAINQPLGFRRIRLQAHMDGTLGTTTRRHSYFYQAEGCDPDDPTWRGTITIGGHWDYGRLMVTTKAGNVRVSVPQDDLEPRITDDKETQTTDRRIEGGDPDKFKGDSTWYGGNRPGRILPDPYRIGQIGTGVGLRKEAWGGIDPSHPTARHFYSATKKYPYRGSWLEPIHLLSLNLTDRNDRLDVLDGKLDGRVTFNGFVDRFGRIVPGGCRVGPDCIPVAIDNMKVGRYQFRADENGLKERSYDVKDPNTGQSLIEYPN